MKNIIKVGIAFVLLAALCAAVCAGESVNVGIDYGNARQSRGAETQWHEGVTALEVLRSVAEVETHQVGEYVFVTSIDGVKGKCGDKAWYYEINGERADKLAFARILRKNESTRWLYKEDVCSPKVDNN